MHLRAQDAATTLAVVLCLCLSCCQKQGNTVVPDDNPANGSLTHDPSHSFGASGNNTFGSAGMLDPPASTGSATSIPSGSRYWIKTGDSVNISWNAYNLDVSCPDNGGMPGAPPTFPLNLCTPGCSAGGQPKSCVLGRNSDELPLPDAVGICPSWPQNHEIVLVSVSDTPFVSDDSNPDGHVVGPESNLNVWLRQFPCMNGNCGSGAVPTNTTSWLWAAGCSPTAVSYTPSLDTTMGGEAILQLWASHRADFTQSPPPQSDDQPGPTLNVVAVAPGAPRPDTRRVHFTEECGPGQASCDNANDPTESQWCNGPSRAGCAPTLDEVFSAQLRVKEVRAFVASNPASTQPAAFCYAYLAGNGNTAAASDCDASAGPQVRDCKASPGAAVNLSPADKWKIVFSDQGSGGAASRCPNDSNRTDVWVEFTLETKP